VKSIKRYVQLVVVCATVALAAPFLLMGIFSQRTFPGEDGQDLRRRRAQGATLDGQLRYDLTVSEFMSGQVKRTKR